MCNCLIHILLLLFQQTISQTYLKSISLHNVHSCMFPYFYVIIREFYICTSLIT